MGSNQSSAGNFYETQHASTPTPGNIERAMALTLDVEECIKAHNYKEAIEKFTQAIVLCPDRRLFCCRACLYCLLKQYDNAINDCRAAIELDPKCSNAYSQLGVTFDALNRNDEAIEAFKKSLELDPGNERSRTGLASVEKKLKIENYAKLHCDLGLLYYAQKRYDAAYKKALEFDPECERSRKGLALAESELREANP